MYEHNTNREMRLEHKLYPKTSLIMHMPSPLSTPS